MTYPRHPARTLRRTGRPPTRVSAELIAELANRLTGRDYAICEHVWDHRVLTTGQVAAIFFTSLHRSQRRLLELHQLGVLSRFQPWAPVGSHPWHWVLGPAGGHVLAARRGLSPRELGYRPERALAIATSRVLGHQVGVNGFFADLHAHARAHQHDPASSSWSGGYTTTEDRAEAGVGTRVALWWSEQRCRQAWKDVIRPDAFGRWSEVQAGGRPAETDFFLEYDTGTDTLTRAASKLTKYATLAEATGIATPVLYWLPSARREANLRPLLAGAAVPVATAVHTPPPASHPAARTTGRAGQGAGTGRDGCEGPAGALWLPVGTTGPRRRLATLSDAWGGYATTPRPVTEGATERDHPPNGTWPEPSHDEPRGR